jgi:ubiquinone/menaquinone biosynthesis C-methylase UbiE
MEDLNFIASQLRKPSGEFAVKIAEKMEEGNRPLYDLALESIQFQDHDSILEIGFGSGTHFPDLLAKAKNLRVNGIDYSPEMTNLAAASNKSAAESGRLKLYTANSNQLPFNDSSFDTVFCNMVIYFWDDPAEHLREVHRVQKPGGTFYTGMRTRESMVQFPFTKFGFNLYGVEEWKTILRSNGFIVSDEFRKKDPVFDDDGKRIQLESVCIAANI